MVRTWFGCGLDVGRRWLGRVFGSGADSLAEVTRESGFQHSIYKIWDVPANNSRWYVHANQKYFRLRIVVLLGSCATRIRAFQTSGLSKGWFLPRGGISIIGVANCFFLFFGAGAAFWILIRDFHGDLTPNESLQPAELGAHQGGPATTRFLEVFLEGSLTVSAS